MRPRWRIIETGADDAFTNMALDEALFRGYIAGYSPPTLRIYSWKSPSLSLGYSQDAKSVLDTDICRETSTPFVRRLTGGSIILHDRELTYSLVCSKRDLDIPAQIDHSYKTICSFLILFYKKLGLNAAFACDILPDIRLGVPGSLCFTSKEKYDIVIQGKKIGGNAQKRSKDVIFQHGSIPFSIDMAGTARFLRDKVSPTEMEGTTSLEELLGRKVNGIVLSKMLAESFMEAFDVTLTDRQLTDAEETVTQDLMKFKYGNPEWNLDRIDITAFESENNVGEVLTSPTVTI